MKVNKKWYITLVLIGVVITTIPVFADSKGWIQKILIGSPKILLYSVIGGGVGVAFSLLKGKNKRK